MPPPVQVSFALGPFVLLPVIQRISILRQVLATALFLFYPSSLAFAQTAAPQPTVTVIRAGKLLDVEAGRTLSNQIVLIRGNKIESVAEDLAIPPGAKIIDLS